jgi:hypothetical protein
MATRPAGIRTSNPARTRPRDDIARAQISRFADEGHAALADRFEEFEAAGEEISADWDGS